jgi:hypothetical protein
VDDRRGALRTPQRAGRRAHQKNCFTSEGTADDGAKVITFAGKMDCPMTGEKDMPVKHVVRIISPDQHVFEMHDPRKGDNSKMMEITYTRK